MRIIYLILVLICPVLLFSQSIKGFKIPDSLRTKNFQYIENAYNKTYQIDNDRAELFANIILQKGKQENNEKQIFEGYYKIARTKNLKGENGFPYADSLIVATKNINNIDYPAKAHILKGILFNNNSMYKEALGEYVIALELNKKKNEEQLYYIKKLIAILKTATEEYKEALPLFLEHYEYEKLRINSESKDSKTYIASIFSLANIYAKLKDYHNSIKYIDLGIYESGKYNDFSSYNYLMMLKGINQYYLKNLTTADKTLSQTLQGFIKNKDNANLGIIYYYLGKIKYDTDKKNVAVNFFIKADSISFVSNSYDPNKRDGYEIIIDYYKKNGDYKNQLKYVDRLIHSDSIVAINRKNLSKDILKKYDTPLLMQEKESLIKKLNNKNKIFVWLIAVLLSITLFFIFIIRKNKLKIKEYERQAKALIEKSSDLPTPLTLDEKNAEKINTIEKKEDKIVLSNDPKFKILISKIDEFESNNGFLKKNLTLDSLAKEFQTNRDYLSKLINELKNKNFSQYLNELRINYIVEELKSNNRIRKHTIAAIAEDIGYNNSESFTNAFKKITGTLPSYFIKALNEKDTIN